MASPPDTPSNPPPTSSNPTKPFRFKRPRSPSPTPSDPPRKRPSLSPSSSLPNNTHRHHHHHHHRHHHHRSKRPPQTPPDTPSSDPQKHQSEYLDPDAAFRESLFDALADDEGAAFWQGVYGQPIHTYSPYYRNPASTSTSTSPSYGYGADAPSDDADREKPELERMDDDEYAAYVRAKMWERSHEHIIQERARREEERKRRRAEEEEGRRWRVGVEEALRRGEERRRRNRWRGVWEGYLAGWEDGKGRIIWPVEGGKMGDVGSGEVERFFRGVGGVGGVDLGDVLKKERVRWHPDKMQQRAGGRGVDGRTMKMVTAVFQVVDRLWTEMRERA